MVTVLLALPHLPSFSDTFDISERFRKPPTRLRASRPNSTSEEGRCKDMTQRTADDTLALLLGSLCLELRVYPSIRMRKETLGPSSAACKNGAMSARGLPHACQRPTAFWDVGLEGLSRLCSLRECADLEPHSSAATPSWHAKSRRASCQNRSPGPPRPHSSPAGARVAAQDSALSGQHRCRPRLPTRLRHPEDEPGQPANMPYRRPFLQQQSRSRAPRKSFSNLLPTRCAHSGEKRVDHSELGAALKGV